MKVSQIFLLSLTVLVLSSCSKKSHSSNTNTIETIRPQTELQTERVESFSYTLEQNGCSTETQNFGSLAEMCQGLQNNTLNNGCALELRAEFYKLKCTGSEFAAFDEEKGNDKNYSNAIEHKKLKNGDTIVELVKPTALGTAKKGAYIPFSCASSVADAMNLENGFTLLNGSKLLINRDQSKVKRKYPQAFLECSDVTSEINENIDSALVKNISLKTGHAIAEYALLSSEETLRTELTYISCSESKKEILLNLTNGVNLIKGSKLLVRRDISNDVRKGIAHPQEFLLVSCQQ